MKKIFFLLCSLATSINYGMNISPRAAHNKKKSQTNTDISVGSIPSDIQASPIKIFNAWNYSPEVVAVVQHMKKPFNRFNTPNPEALTAKYIKNNPGLAPFESQVRGRLTPERKGDNYRDITIDIPSENVDSNCPSYAVPIKTESASSDSEDLMFTFE